MLFFSEPRAGLHIFGQKSGGNKYYSKVWSEASYKIAAAAVWQMAPKRNFSIKSLFRISVGWVAVVHVMLRRTSLVKWPPRVSVCVLCVHTPRLALQWCSIRFPPSKGCGVMLQHGTRGRKSTKYFQLSYRWDAGWLEDCTRRVDTNVLVFIKERARVSQLILIKSLRPRRRKAEPRCLQLQSIPISQRTNKQRRHAVA